MKTIEELGEHFREHLKCFLGRQQGHFVSDQLRSEIRMYACGQMEKLIVTDETNFDEYIIQCGIQNNSPETVNNHECNVFFITPKGNFNIKLAGGNEPECTISQLPKSDLIDSNSLVS